MNILDSLWRVDTAVLLVWSVVLAVAFVLMLIGCIRAISRLRRVGRERRQRFEGIRIRRMLEHVGLDLDRYLHDVNVLRTEHHLERCARCCKTKVCDAFFRGEVDAPEESFCPNFGDLQCAAREYSNKCRTSDNKARKANHPIGSRMTQ